MKNPCLFDIINFMRIDAGKFKGRRLVENKYPHIRPTTDKVRQALFVKLQFFVEGKSVLDLFCGTGALGIEALSRGAEKVTMVDKDFRSVLLTKENLRLVGAMQKVVKCDALVFLDKCNEQFDLILIDPPYRSGLYGPVLEKIFNKNLLADEGIIVCEHLLEEKIDDGLFEVFDEKKYGDTILTYLRHKG